MVRPKKHLGQHFLTDRSIAGRIASSLEHAPGDPVVEVGPGKGLLTGPLLQKDIRLTAIEIDPESVRFLRNRWPELGFSVREQGLRYPERTAGGLFSYRTALHGKTGILFPSPEGHLRGDPPEAEPGGGAAVCRIPLFQGGKNRIQPAEKDDPEFHQINFITFGERF